jgi:hypothetical protein
MRQKPLRALIELAKEDAQRFGFASNVVAAATGSRRSFRSAWGRGLPLTRSPRPAPFWKAARGDLVTGWNFWGDGINRDPLARDRTDAIENGTAALESLTNAIRLISDAEPLKQLMLAASQCRARRGYRGRRPITS